MERPSKRQLSHLTKLPPVNDEQRSRGRLSHFLIPSSLPLESRDLFDLIEGDLVSGSVVEAWRFRRGELEG